MPPRNSNIRTHFSVQSHICKYFSHDGTRWSLRCPWEAFKRTRNQKHNEGSKNKQTEISSWTCHPDWNQSEVRWSLRWATNEGTHLSEWFSKVAHRNALILRTFAADAVVLGRRVNATSACGLMTLVPTATACKYNWKQGLMSLSDRSAACSLQVLENKCNGMRTGFLLAPIKNSRK